MTKFPMMNACGPNLEQKVLRTFAYEYVTWLSRTIWLRPPLTKDEWKVVDYVLSQRAPDTEHQGQLAVPRLPEEGVA